MMNAILLALLGYGVHKIFSKKENHPLGWKELEEISVKRDLGPHELDRFIELVSEDHKTYDGRMNIVKFCDRLNAEAEFHRTKGGVHPANAAARNIVMIIEDGRFNEIVNGDGQEASEVFFSSYHDHL